MTPITKSRMQAGITQAATMLLTVLAWVAAQGTNPMPGLVPERTWQAVTLVAALAIGVWNGWKNQNWTGAAVAAQSLLDQIKTGSGTDDHPAATPDATGSAATVASTVTVQDASGDAGAADVTPVMTGESLPTGTASTGATA